MVMELGLYRMRASALAADSVEGGPQVPNVAGAVVGDGDAHHVEAAAGVRQAPPLEIVLRQAREPPLLVPRHGLRGRVAPARVATLDLDEDDHGAVTAHEIDLAVHEAHVALDHAEPRRLQELRGRFFRFLSERASPVRHARRHIAGGALGAMPRMVDARDQTATAAGFARRANFTL